MRNIKKTWPALALGLLMTACGPTKVAVNTESVKQIREIALLRVTEPTAYVAQDFGNPGLMFGAVGGAVAGSSSAHAGKNVNTLAIESGFRAGEQLTTYLGKHLEAAGYKVQVVDTARPDGGKLLDSYEQLDAGSADAVLDVSLQSVGYATEHPMLSPHWRPMVQVQVALVDRRSGQTVYSEKFMYGYHNPFLSGTDLDAPAAYHFEDKDALFADRDKLIKGMAHGIEAVARAVDANMQR